MITIIVWLIVIGVCLYIVNAVIPMPDWVKTLINCVVALFVVLWILQHVLGVPTGIRIR